MDLTITRRSRIGYAATSSVQDVPDAYGGGTHLQLVPVTEPDTIGTPRQILDAHYHAGRINSGNSWRWQIFVRDAQGTWQPAADSEYGSTIDGIKALVACHEDTMTMTVETPVAAKRPGRPPTRGPLTRLDTNIRADVAAVLTQIADTTGVSKAQLVERAIMTAWPEHFDHD